MNALTTAQTGRGRLAALIAVNALLAAVTLAGLLTARAQAQGGSPRARGSYLMVSGRATGISGNVVYIVDSANQELIALRYQRASGRLDPMGYRSLVTDSTEGGAAR